MSNTLNLTNDIENIIICIINNKCRPSNIYHLKFTSEEQQIDTDFDFIKFRF